MARLIEQGLTVVATKIAGVAGHVFRGPARVIRSWMLPDKLSHDLRSLLVHPSGPATVAWRGYKNHTSNLAEAAERTYNQRRHSRSSASNQHASAGARAVVQRWSGPGAAPTPADGRFQGGPTSIEITTAGFAGMMVGTILASILLGVRVHTF